MKIAKKEIGIAMALALTITVLSVFYNTTTQRDSFESSWELQPNAGNLRSMYGLSSEPSERVQIMDANIQGKLKNGTFETVVPSIDALTREKGGFIVTERLSFKNGLWSGDIVSKLPPTNASTFTIEARKKIDENGQVINIVIDIREFAVQNTTNGEQYSTIKTFLSEEFGEEKETPEPVIQLMSVLPILVTGLVWVAGGLVVGVPLCFISLGVVMLVKRVIIPLWKKELSKPV